MLTSLALAAAVSFSLFATASAGAASYSVKTTKEFVEAVASANANTEANTIVLASGTYAPAATVIFTNTHGTLRRWKDLRGPSTTKTAPAILNGS